MFVKRRDATFLSLWCQAGSRGTWPARLTYCSSETGDEFVLTLAAWDKERGKERIIKQCIMQYSKADP